MSLERINWVDWAKSICILLMVCGHSHPLPFIHDFLYLFHLPVFFIISGLLYKPKKFSYLLKGLLLPVIIWNIINYPWYLYSVVKFQDNITINNLIFQPFLGLFFHDFHLGIPICGPFWFVLVIFILRIYHQLVASSKRLQLVTIVFCFFIAVISDEAPQKTFFFLTQRAVIAYPFFYLGTTIKNYSQILNMLNRNQNIYLIITIVVLVIYSTMIGSFDLYSCQLNIFPMYYVIGCVGFIFIYLLTNKIVHKFGTPEFVLNISKGTLVILGLHNITLFLLSKLVNHVDFLGRGELFSVLTIVILYIPMVYIVKKFPILIGK
jgi:acyltransferase